MVAVALSPHECKRYDRQLQVPAIGATGQRRLLNARVLVVGAGGLGSASALYLAAAGVGTLGIVDHDVVDVSNLQRQVLHTTDRVGVAKVDSAEQSIRAINPHVGVVRYPERLDETNAERIVDGYDAIVDGVDNFETRYVLNEAAVRAGRPLASAAILDGEGRLAVVMPYQGPCYRCIYREPPSAELSRECGGRGVLAMVAGVIGLLQAAEVVKVLTGAGEPLIGRMLVYDALDATFTELRVERDPDCPVCSARRS
jgi:molybdopterin/thiamine biosynthesis adenylyltransferase